jgi:transketolase
VWWSAVENFQTLKEIAKQVRIDTLKLAEEYKEWHVAPAFSQVELLVSLYEKILKTNDKFILSKGHACLSFYIMLRRKGFNPHISGHPDIQINQGIECTTGSLGHGLPIAVGMAMAKKYKKESGRIFIIMGDGESQEGTTWESLNIAKRFHLDNLIVIVDHNKLQALAPIQEVHGDPNLLAKFSAFGFLTKNIDGHDFGNILSALDSIPLHGNQPTAIIANTIKGKGVSFMEQNPSYHCKRMEKEQIEQAHQELIK